MGYQIDVPFLIKSGKLPSVSEKLAGNFQAYLASTTNNVGEIQKLATGVLDGVPYAPTIPQPELVNLQAELIGAAMRWMYNTSPYYHRVMLGFGWDGQSGLNFTSSVFRLKTSIPQLLGSDWFGVPGYIRWLNPGSNLPRVPVCRYGFEISTRWQFAQLRHEFDLPAAPRVLRLLPIIDSACRFKSEPESDQLYGISTEVFEYPVAQSPAQWVPHLAELCKQHRFHVLLVDGSELPMLAGLLEGWDAPAFDLVAYFLPVEDAVPAALVQREFAKRFTQWWPGGGDMPAVIQCRFGARHCCELVQWVDTTHGQPCITDLFSFTCPVFRTVSRFPVAFGRVDGRCMCGRMSSLRMADSLLPRMIKTYVNAPVSVNVVTHLVRQYLGVTGWHLETKDAPVLQLRAAKVSVDAKQQLQNVLSYHGLELQIVDL